MGRRKSDERYWNIFFRSHYDGVIYHRRTADFTKTCATAERVASNESNILDFISMSHATMSLKKRRAGSKMNGLLRMASVYVNYL